MTSSKNHEECKKYLFATNMFLVGLWAVMRSAMRDVSLCSISNKKTGPLARWSGRPSLPGHVTYPTSLIVTVMAARISMHSLFMLPLNQLNLTAMMLQYPDAQESSLPAASRRRATP